MAPLSLTQDDDSVSVSGVGPDGRGDGHRVVAEVVKDVDVLPVVEHIGSIRLGSLQKPEGERGQGVKGEREFSRTT